MAVALIGIPATLYARAFLEPGYVNPTLLALCGIPIVALSVTTVEAVRGFGWLGLAWIPSQVAQPVCVLVIAAAIMLVVGELSAIWAVGAAVLAYVVSVLAQRLIMRARLRSHIQVRADTIDLQLWIRVAFSHLWIFAATIIFIQGGVILVGLSHSAKYVAIYNAAGATSSLMALYSPGSQCLECAEVCGIARSKAPSRSAESVHRCGPHHLVAFTCNCCRFNRLRHTAPALIRRRL